MEINFLNLEQKVLLNKALQKDMPEFKSLFDRWNFAKANGLYTFAKNLEHQLLNSMSELNVKKMEDHFKEKITVRTVDKRHVKNYSFKAKDQFDLHNPKEYKDFCIHKIGRAHV